MPSPAINGEGAEPPSPISSHFACFSSSAPPPTPMARSKRFSAAEKGNAPREGLERLLVKTGHTGPRVEPRRGPQAGKSGDPHSQNADSSPRAQGALGLGFGAKPKGKCGAPRAQQPAALVDAWRLIGCGRLRFPMLPRQLPDLTSPCCMQGKTIITCDRGDRRLAFSCYK